MLAEKNNENPTLFALLPLLFLCRDFCPLACLKEWETKGGVHKSEG
jgi:hypothetical protein